MKKIFYYILPILLCFVSCNKSVEPDLCWGEVPISADFGVFPRKGVFDSLEVNPIDYDTLLRESIRFTAKQQNLDYKWEIGAGVYTLGGFYLNFRDYRSNKPVTVKLSVKRKYLTPCSPNDTAIKSVTRQIYFADSSKIFGSYEGRFDYSDSVTSIVTISWYRSRNGEKFMYISDYPLKGDTTYTIGPEITYNNIFIDYKRSFFINPLYCWRGGDQIKCADGTPKGVLPPRFIKFEINENGELVFSGLHALKKDVFTEFKFIGKRIY